MAYEKLGDGKGAKVSFEEKIKSWIPAMAAGRKLDLGGVMWSDFLFLQAIRDNEAVHAKRHGQGSSFADLAQALNKFRSGIANFLLQLHIHFDEPAPRAVIRACYFPEVYVPKKPSH